MKCAFIDNNDNILNNKYFVKQMQQAIQLLPLERTYLFIFLSFLLNIAASLFSATLNALY